MSLTHCPECNLWLRPDESCEHIKGPTPYIQTTWFSTYGNHISNYPETLQAEPDREPYRSDFVLGFIIGAFTVGFWWAVREGIWASIERVF